MIQHIVLLKWKPGTTDDQIEAAFGQAQQLVDEINGVERVTLGRNRGEDEHGYTHALIVKLDDEALDGYLAPPGSQALHQRVAGADRGRADRDRRARGRAHRAQRGAASGWRWDRTPSASAAAAALRWEETHSE